VSTANSHFKDSMKIEDEELRKSLVLMSVDMQMRVTRLRNRYEHELRRYYYVTPTSYLELLSTIKKLLGSRKSLVDGQIKRYEGGINKIAETEAQVEVMQKELEELKPKLEIATVENKELLINLQKNQKDADAKKLVCEGEERECNIQRDEANALRADCQQDLDRVLPLLDQAAAALDKITQDDMTQLKSYVNPPLSAAIVMEGVLYVFNEDTKVPFQPKEPGSI
jgi:dynein heavy chain